MQDASVGTKIHSDIDSIIIEGRIEIAVLEEKFNHLEREVRRLLKPASGETVSKQGITSEVENCLCSIRTAVEMFRGKFTGEPSEFQTLRDQDKSEFERLLKRTEKLGQRIADLELRV